MARIKFLRRNTTKYIRLGRKKLKRWRRPNGRDNKMRLKFKGYPRTVEVGFKKSKDVQGKIKGKNPVIVQNIKQLGKLKNTDIIILSKLGKRKKIEIIKKAKEMGIEIENLNAEKFLEENQKEKSKEEIK